MSNDEIEVLLVEDNDSDAELSIRALHRNNIVHHLVRVKDGAAAIDFLFGKGEFEGRNTDIKPWVILLDLKMPKVDGLDVLKIIKTDNLTKRIPVVVLTSSKENADIKQAYALGANSYLVKPVEYENFTDIVSSLGLYWVFHNYTLV